jgi:signal transduction histidine kinase/ligand-binding sensor domain-containing protein/DNA-binding response OmpR family regulator
MFNYAKPAFCFLLMLSLFTIRAAGQIKCKIEHYSTEDGLSHNRIMCMIKDREGFMWFGTWDGLNRFDGHNFLVYKSRPGDTSSLRNNRIQDIVEDHSGYLWLQAYDNRIYRFDKKKEQFLAITSKPLLNNASQPLYNKIILSKTGQIWLTTKSQGIFLIPNPDAPHPQCIRFAAGLDQRFQLPSNNINFFYEDQQANIWIGTPTGICCLQKRGSDIYSNTNLDKAFSKGIDFTSAADGGDKVWLGTRNGIFIGFDKSSHRFLGHKLSNHSLNGICISKKTDLIYLSTAAGEIITANKKGLSVGISAIADASEFFSIYEDRKGLLWIEPENYGIVKFDPSRNEFKHFNQKMDGFYDHGAKFYKVFEDSNGLVWVSMRSGGFGYYNASTDQIAYFYDEPGTDNHRFSNIVVCTYSDPNGVLWLNADDKGLNKIVFQRNDFNQKLLMDHTVIRSDNEIRGICNDRKNRLWLATKSGNLYVYQNDQRQALAFLNMPKEGIGVVYTIIQDKKNNIWLGTRSNGLFKAEPVNPAQTIYKLSHYTNDKNNIYSLSSNVVYSLLEDSKGRIWVGTYEEGLNLVNLKDGKIQFINIKNSFKNYPKGEFIKVRNVKEDAQSNLWIATTDGLLVLDADKGITNNYRFVSFSKIAGDKESLGKNDIQFIFRDSKNTMWLSTSGGGLNKAIGTDPFKALKFKVYTTEDGLTSDYVLSSVEDNKGNLWLATENGLSKFNPQTERFRNYDSYDGLPKTGFSESSSLKLPSGNLVFGGITGYVSFNPDAIVNHKIDVNMVFTNLQVNNEDVATNSNGWFLKQNIDQITNLTLHHNQNILSIDYAVLDYRLGNKQSYAYRLVGFDKKWHDNKAQRRATYTNLPTGDYTFEVKSSNNDLYINAPYKKLTITILPPPWLTWWAYSIYAVLAIVLIETVRRIAFTMVRLRHRIAVEQKLADLKIAFFTNVSHELRTPLTLILNPIEQIHQKENLSEQGNEYINVVRKNANRMVRFINQLLDLRKVQSGKATLKISIVEMLSFVTRISEYFKDVAAEKQIELNISSNSNELLAWIDAEKLDIVIYNLLANAFKFTPKGKKILISLYQDIAKNNFTIQVADQGEGVPDSKLKDIFELYYEGEHAEGKNLKGTGIGLALSKELIELHHGTISAKNNMDKGLTVTVELNLGKDYLKQDDVVYVDSPEIPHEFEKTMQELLSTTPQQPAPTQIADAPLVLLVEDNTDLRMFLHLQLSNFYRVEIAGNGEEGLQKAVKLIPDLILSDVMMPKMNGIQMLDNLKHNPTTSHIPVILLTARFSIENQIEGLKYGADCYITKPFHNDFLMAAIQNLLKQRKQIFETILNGKKTIELKPGEIAITSHDEVFLKKIIKVVEDHMADPEFNIDIVAGSMNMARSTFYKKFKSLTNLTTVEFVRDMRLKRAKQYLDCGKTNIAEIADLSGFSNAKYFSTCFKEQYKISPSDYLKLRSNKV